jgi:hypothetical protein
LFCGLAIVVLMALHLAAVIGRAFWARVLEVRHALRTTSGSTHCSCWE